MEFPFLRRSEKQSPKKSTVFIGSEDQAFTEQFKALRAKFEYRAGILNYKLVAITSAIAGEGKTTTAVNLAMNIASAGRKKVLLIDVDLRKSGRIKGIQKSSLPGLSEYLTGSVGLKDVVRNTFAPGFYLIPGGMRISSPGDLLAGERFRNFLKEIRNQFDVILLDTPPVVPVSDTLAFRDLVDGFIFIYRAGFTPHTLFRQAVDEIGEKNILGVVLNGVEPQTHRYYQRYYGKYYSNPAKGDSSS